MAIKKQFLLRSIFIFVTSIYFSIGVCAQNNAETKRYVLLITEVLPGYPAEIAGFAVHDILISLGNRSFYDSSSPSLGNEFMTYQSSLPPGKYKAEVLRQGEKVALLINFSSSSSSSSSLSPKLGVTVETLENNPQYYFEQALEVLKGAQTRVDLNKAADFFEKAKALAPKWDDVYYNLGLLYEKLDYYPLAVDNLVVSLRSCLSSNEHYEEDCEKIAVQLGAVQQKGERLEKAKSLMANGKWNLIRKIPDDALVKTSAFYPDFSFDKEGKMWMTNSLISFLKNFKPTSGDDQLTYLIKENIKRHPRFVVNFDGRYFEIREFYIWEQTDMGENTRKESEFFYPECTLYKGEIDFSSPQILIKIREYVRHLRDNPYLYPSYDRADEEIFKILPSIEFDELKDFQVESQWKIE